jgi:hypothetical protein
MPERAKIKPVRADPAGTARYASRFPGLRDNFRSFIGLQASSIGIGTYLGEPDDTDDKN